MHKKILIVFGTRPEAIKMAPLCLEATNFPDLDIKICVTGQHREMLDQVMDIFHLTPHFDLNVMTQGQNLSTITSKVLIGMSEIIENRYRPDLVLVHGDTTTAFATTLAGFYSKIPIGHVEAGLRTNNIYSPWPEEANRVLISRIAKYNFCPTELNKENLLREGISNESIYVTGNTIVDSLRITSTQINNTRKKSQIRQLLNSYIGNDELTTSWESGQRGMVLITAHRRESFGLGFEELCLALLQLAHRYPNIDWVYPVHLNPNVSSIVGQKLANIKNVLLIKPIGYEPFIYLMTLCKFILTDSGGVQEEAPTFKKPVLVMRDHSERPEAISSGVSKLIGMNCKSIFNESCALIENSDIIGSTQNLVNPYGDGFASNKILDIIRRSYE